MESLDIHQNIQIIKEELGNTPSIVVKEFYIGENQPLEAVVIYVNGLANKDIIDRDILNPLMLYVKEDLNGKVNITNYISKKYISMSNTIIESDIQNLVRVLKRGKTVLLINGVSEGIILDTTGGAYRTTSEPINESVVRGPREGFVENLEINVSMIRRIVKEKNLKIDFETVGRRSQTAVAIIYLDDVVNKEVLDELRRRISFVDLDGPIGTGELQQYIEDYTYTVFPQTYLTERPDKAIADMMEGKIIVLMEGYAVAMTAPTLFIQFFQAVEDYNQRTVISSFVRMLRLLAAFMVITLPASYLTLLKFNAELIPIKFMTPIIQSRIGIALTPFLEIFAMELVVEFLREGGLRLPSKIAQTLSLVGGIIIGDTAIKSKIVSPTTLLIVGVTVIATFVIPNYDMSLAIRILRFPMLVLADMMGIFGIAVGWFMILVHLSSIDSLGVPYFDFQKSDMKDSFVRAPLWKMNKRPEGVYPRNIIRQLDFRSKFRRK